MKIINKQKTHFMKKTKSGLYNAKYDTIENVHILINAILDKGFQSTKQAFQTSKEELV